MLMLMIGVGYGRVSSKVYLYAAGVIDHTLLKIKFLNQHTIIGFEWQNEENELKSNKGIYCQIERIKKRKKLNCYFY